MLYDLCCWKIKMLRIRKEKKNKKIKWKNKKIKIPHPHDMRYGTTVHFRYGLLSTPIQCLVHMKTIWRLKLVKLWISPTICHAYAKFNSFIHTLQSWTKVWNISFWTSPWRDVLTMNSVVSLFGFKKKFILTDMRNASVKQRSQTDYKYEFNGTPWLPSLYYFSFSLIRANNEWWNIALAVAL